MTITNKSEQKSYQNGIPAPSKGERETFPFDLTQVSVRATGAPDSRRILSNITVCNYDITHLQENPQRLG